MKYTKLVIRSADEWPDSTGIKNQINMEKWLAKNFGRPGAGQRWFQRTNTKVLYTPRDRRRTRDFVYGTEVCYYFREAKDLTLFGLMYNG
jgi:hypothetical protein